MSKQATYYHNPRCSKSRKGLELVKKHGFPCIVKEYLKKEMTPLICSAGLSKGHMGQVPQALFRTKKNRPEIGPN